MARAIGARAQVALAFECVYGTAPASGFHRMPFASSTLGSEQPLLNSELLGYGRDPLAPVKDAVTADGDVVVPIDAEAWGVWLKGAFGAPTATGTGPYAHEFRSGSWNLAVNGDRDGDAGRAALRDGDRLRRRPAHLADAAFRIAHCHRRPDRAGRDGRNDDRAGTPSDWSLKRFGHFAGSISRNGVPLGNVVSAEVTYANNLDRIETIRADGRIDGADPSIAALTGRSRSASPTRRCSTRRSTAARQS